MKNNGRCETGHAALRQNQKPFNGLSAKQLGCTWFNHQRNRRRRIPPMTHNGGGVVAMPSDNEIA